jgi:hypothetical protein
MIKMRLKTTKLILENKDKIIIIRIPITTITITITQHKRKENLILLMIFKELINKLMIQLRN